MEWSQTHILTRIMSMTSSGYLIIGSRVDYNLFDDNTPAVKFCISMKDLFSKQIGGLSLNCTPFLLSIERLLLEAKVLFTILF